MKILLMLLLISNAAVAAPSCVSKEITSQKPFGVAEMHKLFFHVYDAEFWNDGPPSKNNGWSMSRPHALHLKYFVDIDGADFVKRTLEELKQNPKVNAEMMQNFKQQLPPLMTNVREGDSITASYEPKQGLIFCHNNNRLGIMRDANMAEAFMGIWLGTYTTEPDMRKKLLRL